MDGEETRFSRRSRLDEAMESLDHSSRHMMTLWLAGKSDREIASALGLAERDLAGLLADASRQLRERITELDPPARQPAQSSPQSEPTGTAGA